MAESHYTLTESPDLTGYTLGTVDTPAAWTANAPDASWIGPMHTLNAQASGGWFGLASDPVGLYKYALTFSVEAISDIWLSGSWASDNQSWIYLNGTLIAANEFSKPFVDPLATFLVTDSSLFNVGLNTLEFWVHNASQIVNGRESTWGNPTGLLVSNLRGEYSAVPDAGATALLFGLGLLALAGVKRLTARV